MTDRYQDLFSGLERKGEEAFIPFTVLGDPDVETSLKIIEALVKGGADALELGFPFSDPVADGPAIQAAGRRALEAGVRVGDCFSLIAQIRKNFPRLPVGLLVYANLVERKGRGAFFKAAAKAGADSVLVADLPYAESAPYRLAAKKAGIHLVLMLPLDSTPGAVERIAGASRGYLYLLSRKGVTGTNKKASLPSPELMERLNKAGAPPPVLGFGISRPAHVRSAIKAGCRGAISGSAVVKLVAEVAKREKSLADLSTFVSKMKRATRK